MKFSSIVSGVIAAACAVVFTFAAVPAQAASRAELDRKATSALNELYKKYPKAKELAGKAKAILIFPEVLKAGLMIGAETGDGVMRMKGKTVAYYNTSGASYGLQAGAQKYGYALFIMTDAGLGAIQKAEGFEVGVGPSVVVMDDAMASKTSTTTINKDIYAYIFSQKGLMAGLGVQGNKLTKLD